MNIRLVLSSKDDIVDVADANDLLSNEETRIKFGLRHFALLHFLNPEGGVHTMFA
jgi:hypothetical protein